MCLNSVKSANKNSKTHATKHAVGNVEIKESALYIKGGSLPKSIRLISVKIITMCRGAKIQDGKVGYAQMVMATSGNMLRNTRTTYRATLGNTGWLWKNRLEDIYRSVKLSITLMRISKIIRLRIFTYSNLNRNIPRFMHLKRQNGVMLSALNVVRITARGIINLLLQKEISVLGNVILNP